MRVSVVIPVYNSEHSLRELYRQLMPAMEAITDHFEVIMVEDGGQDRSWEIIRELGGQDTRIRAIKLSRNFGQHNALLCGIREARFDVIVTMDDDLQHPVSQIAILLDKLQEGYDVVYGTPNRDKHEFWRSMASRLSKLALRSVMGIESASNVSAFRAFNTRLRSAFAEFRSPSVSIDVLLTWATSEFSAVRVEHAPRLAGKSNYTLRKLIRHAFDLMTGFSTLPLRIASLVGFVFTLFGLAVLVWVLGRFLIYGSVVPGFVFLASIVAIFAGAQMFTLGIIGEYLARMYNRTIERPAYIVLERTDSGEDIPAVRAPKSGFANAVRE